MEYRPEIDGMRAIAVLAVILFHAGLGLPGGYVGVDIFFVISGFLITTIILRELAADNFSFIGFFERRARRILPALTFVCLACVPFAYLWMLPDEFENFGQSLVATALSANNILLHLTTEYWAVESGFKPLMHTWSLGVEEQFYLIAPFLLALVWRISPRLVAPALGGVAVVSLAFAMNTLEQSQSFAFYMLPTRAWELAAGALIAVVLLRRPGLRTFRAGGLLAVVGIGLVVIPLFIFDDSTPTPGLPMLAPVLGTCLVILFATPDAGIGRLLACKPMVTIGLISFSAYLWHQPLFAFARVYAVDAPPHWVFALLSLATLGLAWATWRWVETPFRDRKRISRAPLFATTAAGVALAALAGAAIHVTDGMPSRLPASANAANATIAYNEAVFSLKHDSFTTNGRRVLVIGHSFGRDFVNAARETFQDRMGGVELIYRDDFPACLGSASLSQQDLISSADAVIYASGEVICFESNLAITQAAGQDFVVVGDKHFGANLNWLMRADTWASQSNEIADHFLVDDHAALATLPAEHYVSWLEPVVTDGRMPITDQTGRVLTTDRRHFSQAGAVYFGQRVLLRSPVERAIFG